MTQVTARIIDAKAYAVDLKPHLTAQITELARGGVQIAAGVAAARHSLDGQGIQAHGHLAAAAAG